MTVLSFTGMARLSEGGHPAIENVSLNRGVRYSILPVLSEQLKAQLMGQSSLISFLMTL
jgi:hypothetical protein